VATPHVSGVALVLWNEIREALLQSAQPLTDDQFPTSPSDGYGHGAVKYWAAYDYLVDNPCEEASPRASAPLPVSGSTKAPKATKASKATTTTNDINLSTKAPKATKAPKMPIDRPCPRGSHRRKSAGIISASQQARRAMLQ
jgi:hypothetical protein